MSNNTLFLLPLTVLLACADAADSDPTGDSSPRPTETSTDTASTTIDCVDFGKTFRVGGAFAWDDATGTIRSFSDPGGTTPPWVAWFFGTADWSGDFAEADGYCQVVRSIDTGSLTRVGSEYAVLEADLASSPVVYDTCANAPVCDATNGSLTDRYGDETVSFTWTEQIDPVVEGRVQTTFGVGPEYEWGGQLGGTLFPVTQPLVGYGFSLDEDFRIASSIPDISEVDLTAGNPLPTAYYAIEVPVLFEVF